MFLSHWFELSGLNQVLAPIVEDDSSHHGGHAYKGDTAAGADGDDTTSTPHFHHPRQHQHEEEESPIWSILAPRSDSAKSPRSVSNGRPSSAPASTGASVDANGRVGSKAVAVPPAEMFVRGRDGYDGIMGMVQCRHCHKMTPVDSGVVFVTPAAAAAASSSSDLLVNNEITDTPRGNETSMGSNDNCNSNLNTTVDKREEDEQSHLRSQVLIAATATAQTLSAPTFQWESIHNIFALCAAPPKPIQRGANGGATAAATVPSKNLKKIIKLLTNNPSLVHARSGNLSTLGLPDGYTLLHAACFVGNGEVVDYLIREYVLVVDDDSTATSGNGEGVGEGYEEDKQKLDLNERDLQGRTALHIAAERGHLDIIPLLQVAYSTLEERLLASEKKLLEDSDSSDDDEDGVDIDTGKEGDKEKGGTATAATTGETEQLTTAMVKLSTSDTTTSQMKTPKTPKSRSPKRPKTKSRSPKPPPRNSALSPSFRGSNAPLDLARRTPLGYASTSPVPKAKKNRSQLEKLLYEKGDRSIVGVDHTPPNARCGGGGYTPRGGRSIGRKVVFSSGGDDSDASIASGTTSYLSPTPRKALGRYSAVNTPASSASTANFATPFQSPPTTGRRLMTDLDDEGGAEMATVPEEGGDGSKNNNNHADTVIVPSLQWGASDKPGWRIEMEDAICVHYPIMVPPPPSTPLDTTNDANAARTPTMGLFGVFDGHGDGGFASEFISTHLLPKFQGHSNWSVAYHSCNSSFNSTTEGDGAMMTVLTDSFHSLDEDLKTAPMKIRDGGTTAIVAVVSDGKMFVANVGDSRCILVKKRSVTEGEARIDGTSTWNPDSIEVVPMSEDHKPDLPGERSRIESAGLTVQTDHVPPDEDDEKSMPTVVHRVKKSDKELLGVARAFGDFDYKCNESLSASRQAVVCTPEIVVRERDDSSDMFLVLACDGIWDVMTNDEVGLFVAKRVSECVGKKDVVEGEALASVGDDLLEECLEKGSRDNMSVLIVGLPASGLASVVSSDRAARALAF